MDFAEKTTNTNNVFKGHLISVDVEDVITPEGHHAQREIVHHAPAVAILAINDNDQMILEQQWRSPIHETTLEIPAGKVDSRDGGDPVHAAKRELNEETRYAAKHLTKLSSFYTSVGVLDEFMTLYLATGLTPVKNELPQDQDEELSLMTVSLDQALQMIDNGQIQDAKTIMAIYYWRGIKGNG